MVGRDSVQTGKALLKKLTPRQQEVVLAIQCGLNI